MHITPQNLRRLRKERGLSRRQLAEQSKISQKQIQRLEDPNQASKNVRNHTVERLAGALRVTVEKLVAERQVPGSKVMRVRTSLGPGVHLAYELIEQRYGVTAGQLVNMAPLFFVLLAEGSLAWRQAQLNQLRQAIKEVEMLSDNRKRCAWHVRYAEDGTGYEQDRIDKGELFSDPYPPDYNFDPEDDWDGSPFADYLRQLADEIGKPELVDLKDHPPEGVAGFDGLPTYSVCSGDLGKVVSSGSDAAHALHAGDARLSDIPAPLMAEDASDGREAWLEGQLSPESKEWLAVVARIRESINLGSGADENATMEKGGQAGSEA